MYKHSLLILWVFLLIVMTILHIIALKFFLYWIYSWFDIMMHFLGGMIVVLSSFWFFFQSRYVHLNQNIHNIIFVAISSIIFIGIGWEIFEIIIGVPVIGDFVLDTITDLVMDVIGASVATFIFMKIYVA